MSRKDAFLSPAEAARTLGISAKALRLYEQRGMISPLRTAAGWRTYGPADLARARQIADWRALGLSLKQAGNLLDGDAGRIEAVLRSHQGRLEDEARRLGAALADVRARRTALAPAPKEKGPAVRLTLPWPWGGEGFELPALRPLTYLTGPLGCGKTRLAKLLAEAVPGASFVGLERLDEGGAATEAELAADDRLRARVAQTLDRLRVEGATSSPALRALITALHQGAHAPLVVDMVEEGLDQATQAALIAYLRAEATASAPLVLMTRSSVILDLAAVGPEEAIIYCPANHSPPSLVAPHPGAPGYEALASCLASPEVRARTAGVIASLPHAADVSGSEEVLQRPN